VSWRAASTRSARCPARSGARSSNDSPATCCAEWGSPAPTRCCCARSRPSILAALEDEAPALDAAGYRRLVDAAFAYLRDERDLRALEPGVGWIHATAHTADLLKFLARDARFAPADAQRLLEAVAAKLITPGAPVFTHAEEERLAAAVASLVRRSDFDLGILDPWLGRFVAAEKQVWREAPPQQALLDAAQNGRSFLRCLYVTLSLPAAATPGTPAPPPTREKVLATLATIRR